MLSTLQKSSSFIGRLVLLLGILYPVSAWPEPDVDSLDKCLLRTLREAPPATTVDEIRLRCAERVAESIRERESKRRVESTSGEPVVIDKELFAPPKNAADSLLYQRLQREEVAETVRSVLIPHRRNYILPIAYVSDPNEEPFEGAFGDLAAPDRLDNLEMKFQVSVKYPVFQDLLTGHDQLYVGFTALSFWQAYNKDASAPFRETNYEPEIFWVTPIPWRPFDLDAGLLSLGISHQSNGRGGSLSRSWNRVYANFLWEKGRRVYSIKPWWRLSEEDKSDPLDPDGDDNSDISKYMGHFEFATVYRRKNQELALMLRNNLRSDNIGALQLEWTFPLWRGVRGYAQYFNGYGESLIDYNAHIERLGVGFLLTDLL